jgi:hypothetical protein
MIEYRPTPLATVSPGVPALLQQGYYVKFSDKWPASLSHVTHRDSNGKTRGNFFQVKRTNQVNHDLHHIIPSADFRDVDFSNTASNFNENLYPTSPETLYEIAVGFKPANVLVHFHIPSGEFVSRLEQPGMIPNVASPLLRYLGAKRPSDSPYEDKRLFLYTVFNMDAFIMRLYIDSGVDFDKVVAGLVVNKCLIEQITQPTPEAQSRAKLLLYYSELRW